ncbi:hypothetical protein [Limobrevibacterium gyesilva]|uniref:Uncharacterized protein n=1 Tax=Limobrevibacterium gyesilva TaxID=2991712 RepID=A0AA41YSH0_9PROT|nr:hypothetical protein [Limobrevibacterium gyesilva]MCW3477727.1 hypothetical protein [Limobrevibacterium gyesilva]
MLAGPSLRHCLKSILSTACQNGDLRYPLDREAEFRRLILDPLPSCTLRGEDVGRGRAAEGFSVRPACSTVTNKGANEFANAAWLDPGKQFSIWSHRADTFP